MPCCVGARHPRTEPVGPGPTISRLIPFAPVTINRSEPINQRVGLILQFAYHVINSLDVAVPAEHRLAKTYRLEAALLKRVFIEWPRGERNHCKPVSIPTLTEENAKRPNRRRESLVGECIIDRLAKSEVKGFGEEVSASAGLVKGLAERSYSHEKKHSKPRI